MPTIPPIGCDRFSQFFDWFNWFPNWFDRFIGCFANMKHIRRIHRIQEKPATSCKNADTHPNQRPERAHPEPSSVRQTLSGIFNSTLDKIFNGIFLPFNYSAHCRILHSKMVRRPLWLTTSSRSEEAGEQRVENYCRRLRSEGDRVLGRSIKLLKFY